MIKSLMLDDLAKAGGQELVLGFLLDYVEGTPQQLLLLLPCLFICYVHFLYFMVEFGEKVLTETFGKLAMLLWETLIKDESDALLLRLFLVHGLVLHLRLIEKHLEEKKQEKLNRLTRGGDISLLPRDLIILFLKIYYLQEMHRHGVGLDQCARQPRQVLYLLDVKVINGLQVIPESELE